MIIRVSKDLESGSWGDDGKFTGEVTYAVITDSSDGLSLFSNKESLKQANLPLRGDVYLSGGTDGLVSANNDITLYVQNVSFDRREDRNFKDNGHLAGKGSGSYTIWDYVVTVTSDPSLGASGGGGGSGGGSSETPTTMSIAPKFYEVYDERQYKLTDIIGKPTGVVLDKSGHVMPTSRQVVNTVLTFTYTMRDFRMSYIHLALFTVNKDDVQVCGIDIPKYCGKIINLSASKNESTGDFNVSCEIEIGIQKNVFRDELISKGYYANLIGANNVQGKGVRLQRAPSLAEAQLWNTEEAVVKKRVPGQYGNSVYGNWGVLHNDCLVEDPVIHDPKGFPYVGSEEEVTDAIQSGKVGIVYKQLSVPANWKPLDFPKRGFKG